MLTHKPVPTHRPAAVWPGWAGGRTAELCCASPSERLQQRPCSAAHPAGCAGQPEAPVDPQPGRLEEEALVLGGAPFNHRLQDRAVQPGIRRGAPLGSNGWPDPRRPAFPACADRSQAARGRSPGSRGCTPRIAALEWSRPARDQPAMHHFADPQPGSQGKKALIIGGAPFQPGREDPGPGKRLQSRLHPFGQPAAGEGRERLRAARADPEANASAFGAMDQNQVRGSAQAQAATNARIQLDRPRPKVSVVADARWRSRN
jgi:hypothetical protein